MPLPDDLMYGHILHTVSETPWAILPEKLALITELLSLRATGHRFTAAEIDERIGPRAAGPGQSQRGTIAVLPLFGVVSQRMNMMSDMSGGTSTERFAQAFRQVMADPSVSAVVLQVDSPGGSVFGIDELAGEIFRARGGKPIVAQVDSMAASAAFWIASAADEIAMTPGGQVGSIGVYTVHQDISAAAEAEGVKTTFISAGKYKTEGNPFEPLTDEARAAMQGQVDDYYNAFTKAVAKGRGVSVDSVRNGYGQGRVVGAGPALSMGMVDRIATMDQTLARLSSPQGRARTGQRSEEDYLPPVALAAEPLEEESLAGEEPAIEPETETPLDQDEPERLALALAI